MKRVNLFRLFILIILIGILFAGCTLTDDPGDTTGGDAPAPLVGVAGDEVVDNACYLHTPRMTEDAFRYLDEIYIEKYPQLGLRWEHGTGADQRIMTAFAQQVTQGCTTDAEKVTAIYNWITANIRYAEASSPFSYDVLYSGYGNCLGQAMLMQDMCRVLGIPAVYSDGFRGNMKTFSVEDMRNAEAGHAWLFVYVDGQWMLYDPTWRTEKMTDQTYIATNFFIDKVGGIMPIYDENNIPPFSDPIGSYCYRNGCFVVLCDGVPTEEFGGTNVNFCMNVNGFAHGDDPISAAGAFYLEGAAAFAYVGREACELYSSGWIGRGESGFKWGDIGYAYENGILASETVMEYDGETYYLFSGLSRKICLPDVAFRMMNGILAVDTSYTGKIWEPHKNMLPEGDYTYEWFSTDESVATVDQNGVVTCHKEGDVDICVLITGTAWHGNEKIEWTEEKNPLLIEADIVDGVVVGEKTFRGFSLGVYFTDDIARPEKYAALDNGGSTYVEFEEVSSPGYRDIYPIMTDDILMMFDPVDGIVTLPTAQNADGYFILPDTYESALKFPYDFELPLTEGSVILDREKLKTFTLVDTGKWGEMWYLPLTEEGKNAWGPGTSVEPEQPTDIDFGYPMIPTGDILMDYLFDDIMAGITPVNNVITLPPMLESNSANLFLSALRIAGEQDCGLEFTFSSGSMTLDAAAVNTILSGPDAEAMDLWLIRMQSEWCDYGQKERLERMAVDGIYHLHAELWADNGNINHLNGGNVTVTVPLNSTGGQYEVFFLDAHGNYTKVPSTVNGGTITFEAPYFATYAIIDTAQTPVK